VLPVRVDPTGQAGPTKREAAGPEWRRSSRGWHVQSYVEQTPAQRVAELGMLLPAKYGSVTGWGSLTWRGGWWFTGTRTDRSFLPVPLALARHLLRWQPGMRLCEERWDPAEVEVVDGLPVASAVRAACFEARYAPDLESAVVALDLAAFHDLVSIEEAADWMLRHPSYTGIEQGRQAVGLADENAWSPTEPSMRLEWLRAGFPCPLTNRPIFDRSGRHIATPDLVDPHAGVVGEYNGGLHLEGQRRYADIKRDATYRSLGLEPVEMVAGDLSRRWEFRQRLAAAYARAESRPVADRRWTLELPPWWTPTFTVEQRRALSQSERQRLLKNRLAS
jgi:hypothetical protein